MKKYDDASWHYGGKYPDDLPNDAAATHIGIFLAWCLLNGYAAGDVVDDWPEELQKLRSRRITPGAFVMEVLDEKFTGDCLTDEGNAFAVAYYEGRDGASRYLDDYVEMVGKEVVDIYRIPDTWGVFDRMAERLGERHAAWVAAGKPRFIL